ncbi:ADP-ribosyl-[dinitrogen reductase] hydrolase [Azohydromonas lata]|uniref:ADP-ribosyl-[dinitrogen reductase] hydrolase n=1 Tax=Azohydromonas lata TaxID=45677 RepID=A0ABU5IQ15_9BURK|nr:ADP-ribosyl-[dinitrogen reductase] hydrolase [Azohydromonas lata]MDZ5460994.1 ADP-ribosyl-[dinitrogen reductase] hydrolase [Azohydromonas lata]
MAFDEGGAPGALLDRALGAYLGLALGDALGATVEFMTPREIALRFSDQGGVHRRITGGGWLNLPPGQVTDDTTMSLALGQALLEGRRQGKPGDTRLIAEAFVAWWRGRPVDCGNTCRRGIQRFIRTGALSTPLNDGDGGNGAVMRNLPAALATLGDDEAFERISLAQAHLTHNHPYSDAATLGLGHLLRLQLAGANAEALALQAVQLVQKHPVFRFEPYPGRASGYVVDTVQTVLWAFTQHADFEEAVVAAANRGEDADTTAALVGMLAGARCGAAALPRHWLKRLVPDVARAITEQTRLLVAPFL